MTNNPFIGSLTAGKPAQGLVPDRIKQKRRYPFVFLVDVSSSTTAGGDQADIHAIHRGLAEIFQVFRSPPPNSELADRIDQIDVCLISYADKPLLIFDWSLAPDVPSSVNLATGVYTYTGEALTFAFKMIAERLAYFRDPSNKIPSGLPHVFHITDGAPSDLKPGQPLWIQIQEQLGRLAGGANPEKQMVEVLHFVTPNGCRQTQGATETGQKIMANLSGAKTVYELSNSVTSMPQLVKMVTLIISSVSAFGAPASGADAGHSFANQSGGAIKNTVY
jgi:uncharacterized protein YegL